MAVPHPGGCLQRHSATGRSPPMPPRIIPILGRLRQDIAADLTKETIEQACRQVKYSWRKRILDPATTIYLFLLQVLHGNTACTHVVHFGNWSFTDSAYCQARKRLPLAVFHWLLEKVAATSRADSKGTEGIYVFFGRPLGRSVDSNPSACAVRVVQSRLPNGRARPIRAAYEGRPRPVV